jgi:hypothetical protein
MLDRVLWGDLRFRDFVKRSRCSTRPAAYSACPLRSCRPLVKTKGSRAPARPARPARSPARLPALPRLSHRRPHRRSHRRRRTPRPIAHSICVRCACASDFVPLVNDLSLLYQILDDYLNLKSSSYHENKSFCESAVRRALFIAAPAHLSTPAIIVSLASVHLPPTSQAERPSACPGRARR